MLVHAVYYVRTYALEGNLKCIGSFPCHSEGPVSSPGLPCGSIIAKRLSARQVILQRRPPSQLGFVIVYI